MLMLLLFRSTTVSILFLFLLVDVETQQSYGNNPSDGTTILKGHDEKNYRQALSYCLEQNNAEAIWIPETGTMQELGINQIPEDIQVQLHEMICDMNAYYYNQTETQEPIDASRLVQCHNQQPLCVFWAWQGQCNNHQYSNYMERTCPLACRLCHTELFRARAWLVFLQDLDQIYHAEQDEEQDEAVGSNPLIVRRRQRVFQTLLSRFGLSDPAPLGLFAEELIHRWKAVMPSFLTKLYIGDLSKEDAEWLRQLHGLDSTLSPNQIQHAVLVQYRERGSIVGFMEATDHLIIRPIQLSIAFAIPSQRALETIRELNLPVLEIGAGTGYWTALLQSMGVTIVAYDAARGTDNVFFDVWYTDQVQRGTCQDVLLAHPSLAKTHALLIIWPNDPDPVDHPQFCHDDTCHDSEPVWDVTCLQSYLDRGGRTVIYVGERQRVLQARYGTKESGMSSTLQFQRLLEEAFDLQRVVPIPQLWLNDDDLTVWTRRKPSIPMYEL